MLYWRSYRITCIAKKEYEFSSFATNTIRGKFGATFRNLVCLKKSSDCSTCMLRFSCPYSYVFETQPPPGTRIMRKYPTAPRPFVISLPFKELRFKEEDRFEIEMTLIGKANEYLPHFAYTFAKMLRKIGFEITSILHEDEELYRPDEINLPLSPAKTLSFDIKKDSSFFLVSLRFETPVRLIYREQFQDSPSFPAIVRNFFRRIVLLDYFHCGGDGVFPFKNVLSELEDVKLKSSSFMKRKYRRFSHRYGKSMYLEGVLGEAVFEPVPGYLLPYLEAMEDLHVGKNTTFGFGKVVVKDARRIA